MAKKYDGAVSFANGFKYSSAVPMDDRSVVSTKEDLLSPETWKNNGVYFAYTGMPVIVASTGDMYTLVATTINDESIALESSWHSVAAVAVDSTVDWIEI